MQVQTKHDDACAQVVVRSEDRKPAHSAGKSLAGVPGKRPGRVPDHRTLLYRHKKIPQVRKTLAAEALEA